MDIKQAIEQQNLAFARQVNRILDRPIPEALFEKQLSQHDPMRVATLAVKTRKSLNDHKPNGRMNHKLTKFDRFILWLKRARA